MATLADVRSKYPQYNDLSDTELADALHSKFYSNIPKDVFYTQVGLAKPVQEAATQPQPQTAAEALRRAPGLAARAVVTGLSAPVTAVTDFLSGAYNLGAGLMGSGSRVPYLSQMQQQGLTQMGLPAPETGAERAAQAGMQALTTAAGAARAAPSLFGGDLARQLPASTAAATVAQPVAEEVKEITGSDLAALVAGVGVAGAVGQSAGNIAGRIAAGKQPVPPTMEQVRASAQRNYQKVSDLGIKLNTTSANELVNKIVTHLKTKDYLPENAPAVANTIKEYQSIVGRSLIEGGGVSFTDVEKMRGLANVLLSDKDKNVARLGKEMISSIDDYFAGLSPKNVIAGAGGIDQAIKTISEARKDWRNLSRATMLDDILNTAEARALRPTASESELIRTGFINLAANKDKMRLFNENERNAIRAVANGGSLDNFLSLLGRFSPLRNQLVVGGAAGLGYASPETLYYTVPTAAAGLGAERLQALLRQRAAQRAIGGLLSGQTPAPQPSMYSRGVTSTLLTQPPLE